MALRSSKDYSHNADVLAVRQRWNELRPHLREQLLAGEYKLGAVARVRTPEKTVELLPLRDALSCKAVAIVLSRPAGFRRDLLSARPSRRAAAPSEMSLQRWSETSSYSTAAFQNVRTIPDVTAPFRLAVAPTGKWGLTEPFENVG